MSERKIVINIAPQDDERCGECPRVQVCCDDGGCFMAKYPLPWGDDPDAVTTRGPLCLASEREHAELRADLARWMESARIESEAKQRLGQKLAELVEEAATKIIADICCRRGLRNEWEQIDAGVRAEIHLEWSRIIRNTIEGPVERP